MGITTGLLCVLGGACGGVLLGYMFKVGRVRKVNDALLSAREEYDKMSEAYQVSFQLYEEDFRHKIQQEIAEKRATLCHATTQHVLDALYQYAREHLGRPVTVEEANLIEALIAHGAAGSPNLPPAINSCGSVENN